MTTRLAIAIACFLVTLVAERSDAQLVGPGRREADAARAIMLSLDEAITSPVPMDRNGAIVGKYLATIDPRRVYFLAGDVAEFRERGRNLEHQLRAGDVSFAYEVAAVYQRRVRERLPIAVDALRGDFEDAAAVHVGELSLSIECCDIRADAEGRMRRIVARDLSEHRLPGETLSQHRSRMDRRFRRFAGEVARLDDDDLLELFFNAVVQSYDPHAQYFSEKTLARFNS